MPYNLVSIFVPEEVKVEDTICHRDAERHDGVIFRCHNEARQISYEIKIGLAKVESDHWFDVIVNVADLNAEEAKEAIAVATKIAIRLGENINEILFKYDKSILSVVSGLNLTITAGFPIVNIGIERRRQRRGQQGQAQKSRPNTLALNISRFVRLVITTARDEEEYIWVVA